MIFRPATPGFLVTLIATILLAIVSFNVPLIKSVYFLKASLTVENVNGTITLGTLGYCIELSTNGTTCTKPSVGYAFDPNALLGDSVSFAQIPTVVVKWITYALFLHVIALAAAGVSAFFGLLAHVREMSMACCSTCISGFAAFIAMVAFIFDIVLFFVVKKRVQAIDGTATFGSAVWLTLAATVLLFFSGCVYACGRCCLSRRPRGGDGRMDKTWMDRFSGQNPTDQHAEQMRLDAVKAEAERKARQKNEVGLPAFPEHQPLKGIDDESDEEAPGRVPYRDNGVAGVGFGGPRRQGSASTAGQTYRGGYAQAPPGTRAVDEYYSPSSPAPSNTGANTGYPPNRQYSTSTSGVYNSTAPAAAAGVAAGGAAGYLAANHRQYSSGAAYGHTNSGTTYHTAASSQHQQYPSTYSQYDPYSQPQAQASAMPGAYGSSATPPPRQPSQHYGDPYTQTQAAAMPTAYGSSATPPPRQPSQHYADPYSGYSGSPIQQQPQTTYGDYGAAYGNNDPYGSNTQNNYGFAAGAGNAGGSVYQSPTQQHQSTLDRSYTLGGGGYGGNVVPDSSGSVPASSSAAAYGVPALTSSPPPMPSASTSNMYGAQPSSANVQQGQGQVQVLGHSHSDSYEDSPPGYDAAGAPGPSVQVAEWGSKGGMHNISR